MSSAMRDPAARPLAARVDARGWGWRHAGRRRPALHDLDLEIEAGERVLLLGASGSGKSTLLHALAGVLGGQDEGEETGELRIDGLRPDRARGRAGLVLQDPDGQAVLARVGDDVAFGLENLGVPRGQMARRIREALREVGLDVALDRSTSALSGGQKQRLALAGVLAMRPGLLLLDEPTANLDPAGAQEVRDAVGRASEGRTLIVVEHRVGLWWSLATRVVVLGPDGVLADGSPTEVLAAERDRLAAAGIWLPDAPPVVPIAAGAGGPILLDGVGLGAAYPRSELAARGIDLRVTAGRALVVTGPNGAGKTALGLTAAGLLAPAEGTLRAASALAGGLGPSPIRWRSRELLTRIGTVFQSPEHQMLATTVRSELELGPRALRRSPPEIDRLVAPLLERLGLSALADAHPASLSGGEKRRLSVATVLATSPQVLVLDEPTFGQDAGTWVELVDLMAEQLREGRALVAVTHDPDLVTAMAGAGERFELAGNRAVAA